MIDNSKEYILCSAIWYDDGIEIGGDNKVDDAINPRHFRGATFQNKNIKSGFVIAQWRHGNVIALRPTNPKFNNDENTVQGFLSSEGVFYDRWQAMWVAYQAGQVDTKTAFKTDLDEYQDFDFDKFLKEIPSDLHENNPMCMMFSEDIY